MIQVDTHAPSPRGQDPPRKGGGLVVEPPRLVTGTPTRRVHPTRAPSIPAPCAGPWPYCPPASEARSPASTSASARVDRRDRDDGARSTHARRVLCGDPERRDPDVQGLSCSAGDSGTSWRRQDAEHEAPVLCPCCGCGTSARCALLESSYPCGKHHPSWTSRSLTARPPPPSAPGYRKRFNRNTPSPKPPAQVAAAPRGVIRAGIGR